MSTNSDKRFKRFKSFKRFKRWKKWRKKTVQYLRHVVLKACIRRTLLPGNTSSKSLPPARFFKCKRCKTDITVGSVSRVLDHLLVLVLATGEAVQERARGNSGRAPLVYVQARHASPFSSPKGGSSAPKRARLAQPKITDAIEASRHSRSQLDCSVLSFLHYKTSVMSPADVHELVSDPTC
jgi:hypothetical protein